MGTPAWLALLSPLPEGAKVERKPVASAEQLATGTAGPIAGWQNVTVNLSEPAYGLRHVQVTLDEHGRQIAGGDHVMFVLEFQPGGTEATLTEHVSIGGRFEQDGKFIGTCWRTVLESHPEDDSGTTRSAEHRPPTDEEIATLRRLIEDVLARDA